MLAEDTNHQSRAMRSEWAYQCHLGEIRRRANRLLLWVLLLHWPAAVLIAIFVTPKTWIGEAAQVHPHVWSAMFFGGVLSLAPWWYGRGQPSNRFLSIMISISLTIWSAVLIHLTGGRIETHFHVFMSLAAIALYRDSRILFIAAGIVALDHFVRGIWWPQSVFGVFLESPYRWVEHGFWVFGEVFFLALASTRGLFELRALADRQVALEIDRELVEERVHERTLELEHQKERAERASSAKDDFLANMNHEVRTPLSAILGYSDLLLQSSPEDLQRSDIATDLSRNAHRLLSLMDNLIEVTSNYGSVAPIHVAAVPWLEEIDEVLQRFGPTAGRGLEVVIHSGALPVNIDIDRRLFRQTVGPVFDNAVKFTDRGTITIDIRYLRESERIEIEIADTGVGIEPEKHEQIFEVLSQADETRTREFEGAGLGLAIARRYARHLGGDIECLESAPGRGSRFKISIPAPATEGTTWVEQPEWSSSPAPRSNVTDGEGGDGSESKPPVETSVLSGYRILLAEDGPDNQRVLSFVLRKAGAEVTVVENGQLAVDAVMASDQGGVPFDIILMDMQMPVKDGYSATRELREAGYTNPILAVTAHALPHDEALCLEAGCCGYLAKPVDRKALISRTRDLIQEIS